MMTFPKVEIFNFLINSKDADSKKTEFHAHVGSDVYEHSL